MDASQGHVLGIGQRPKRAHSSRHSPLDVLCDADVNFGISYDLSGLVVPDYFGSSRWSRVDSASDPEGMRVYASRTAIDRG